MFLDVSEEEASEGPEIWIWGIMEDGERCVLIDRGRRQRFYLHPESVSVEEARRDLDSKLEDKGLMAELRTIEKKRLGRIVNVIEVSGDPLDVEPVLEIARRLFGADSLYEDDLRLSNRYLLEEGISPSSWYKGRYSEVMIDRRNGVDRFFLVENLEVLEKDLPFKPRVLGIDVIYISERGEAKPERDPVAVISVHQNDGKGRQYTLDLGERELLEGFLEAIRSFDPDILVGYASNSLHWNYLLKRADKNSVHLGVGRLGEKPHQSLYGHFSILGRINFDLKDYVDEVTAIQKKNLEELLDYLGIKAVPVESIDPFYYADYWKGSAEKRRSTPFILRRRPTYPIV